MSFAGLSLNVLAGLGALVVATVVLLYLLRPTPRAQQVSHVAFWQRAIQRAKPRLLISRRIPLIALLLSLLVALAMVAVMGDPRFGRGYHGLTVVVLSADRTMGARAQGQTRFTEALARLRTIAEQDTVGGSVAVVRAGIRPTVLSAPTARLADLDRALAGVLLDDGAGDLPAALALAEAIVRRSNHEGRIVVLGDRLLPEDLPRGTYSASARGERPRGRVPVVFAPVGRAGQTVAITAFAARRDPMALGEYVVHCEVHAFTDRDARARLVVRDRDVVISEETLEIAAGGTAIHHAQGFSSNQGELSARLQDIRIEGGTDALAADDVAHATVEPVVPTRVVLVSEGNRHLERALSANPAVQLERVAPADLPARRARDGLRGISVVVLDRFLPNPPLDHPAQMVFAPPSDTTSLRRGAGLNDPRITAWAHDHRALAGVRLEQAHVFYARALLASPDDRVLIRSEGNALAIAREREGARALVFGFETADTDLVQRVGFPILMHNSVLWLSRREGAPRSSQLPGEPVMAAQTTNLVLTPRGPRETRGGALHETTRAGIYHAGERAVAVSDAEEADVLPGSNTRAAPVRAGRSYPPLAVLIALGLLFVMVVEWALYHRGRLP